MVRYPQHANETAQKVFFDKFDGPFFITKIINPHVFKFELPRDRTIHPIFHTNFFRPNTTDLLPGQLTPPPVSIIDEKNQNTWEMTKILNSKMFRNRFQFLVKDRPDWQLFENVIGSHVVLNQYFNKYFIRPGYAVWQQYLKQHFDEL